MTLNNLGVWAATDGFSAANAAGFAKRVENLGLRRSVDSRSRGARGVFRLRVVVGPNDQPCHRQRDRQYLCPRPPLRGRSAKRAQRTVRREVSARAGRLAHSSRGGRTPAQVWQARCHHARVLAGHGQGTVPLGCARRRTKDRPAALGPKMLELSGELADGAHPYNVTPEHTRQARTLVGIGKLLCVEQGAILETNPAQARAIARRFLSHIWACPITSTTGGGWVSATRTLPAADPIG